MPKTGSIAVEVRGLGWYPNPHSPRIFWAGVKAAPELAQLADATSPAERGKLLGLSDLIAGLTAAGLALLGGVALDVLGVTALALGATALAVAPAVFLARLKPAPEPAA